MKRLKNWSGIANLWQCFFDTIDGHPTHLPHCMRACKPVVTRRLVESVGGVFEPVVSSALAVFEHITEKLAVILCLLQATLSDVRQA